MIWVVLKSPLAWGGHIDSGGLLLPVTVTAKVRTPDSKSCGGSCRSRHVLGHTLVVSGVSDGDVTDDQHGAVVCDSVLVAGGQCDRLAATLPAHSRPRLTRHETLKRHSAAARRLLVTRWSRHRRRHCTNHVYVKYSTSSCYSERFLQPILGRQDGITHYLA